MAACASQSEYVTALGPDEQHVTPSCSELVTARIELSKRHWSELSKPAVDGISREEAAKAKLENEEAFKIWESHPEWGPLFFHTFGYSFGRWVSMGSLEVGEKFAEGAQGELFHARVKWNDPKGNEYVLKKGIEYVLKVFKEGTLVQDLQCQWPEGLFRYSKEVWKLFDLGKPSVTYISEVECATLLEDGRFAFLMIKGDGDLRSLIECKMGQSNRGCGPFSKEVGEEIMYRVALGMDVLHSYNIIHRDLKASNVIVKTSPGGKYLWCSVGDFESSIGVVGTGFWRAPEILRALREKNISKTPELFTREVDSYSYGMTYYEVLTGRMPFEDHPLATQHYLLTDLVIGQHLRPELPDFVDGWVLELLHWCWKPIPEERPSFKEILGILEANSNSEYIKEVVSERLMAQCTCAKE